MRSRLLLALIILFITNHSFGQNSKSINYNGLNFGFGVGTWIATSHNNTLDHPALFDLILDARGLRGNPKNSLGINVCGSLYGKNDTPSSIFYPDTTISITKYQFIQWGLEYGRQIWKNDRLTIDLIAELGHGGMYYYHDDEADGIKKSSFHFSTGVSILYPLTRSRYLQLKTQYNIANYDPNNNTSDDFSGNYILAKLIIAKGRPK